MVLRHHFAWITMLVTTAAGAADIPATLPPAPLWHGASEALIAAPDNPWITPAEKTGLTDSPDYDETIAWLKKLSAASPRIKLIAFGQTPQNRTLYLVVASKEGADTAAALHANGRPSLLAQAGIHSGEIDGKDAGLMLLRDLSVGTKTALLDHANFLLVPAFNLDGHERRSEWNRPNQRGPVHQGWRTSAQNLNLNRDYAKADSPEMRAMLALLTAWQPALYLDVHVTDGVDYQYDITYGFHGWDGGPAWSPRIGAWLDQSWRPAMDAALKTNGHIPGPLVFSKNPRDLTQGIIRAPSDPRYSLGFGDLTHLPTAMLENHSLKPYKQRVLGTYVVLEASLRLLGAGSASLQEAIATDAVARPEQLGLNWEKATGPDTTMDFLGIAYEEYDSPASGGKEVRWLGTPKIYTGLVVHNSTVPAVTLRRPKAYWVPSTKPEVIQRLRAHGIQLEELTAAKSVKLEMYRLIHPVAAALPFEGHYPVTTQVNTEKRTEIFAAGSVRVSTDQPLGDLAIALLEPESNDSFLAWNFFPEILQATEYIEGYAIAPMAEKMLAADPQLQADFSAKLKAEPNFAADPTARLRWFYEKTRFFDDRYLLYPVGIER